MKKILKKVTCLVVVYTVIVAVTIIMANRVESLETRGDFRNTNSSVALLQK